jgi:predicted dehydrogenase
MLDDHSIDVVSIATPHHWHAIIAVWACQAGKDVYVEKPCGHNLWEGRQLVRAAAKYNRIVQHGTQSRSMPGVLAAMKQLRQEKVLGDIYLSRGLCFKWRDTIGHTPDSAVPQGVDYDLWTGAAPRKPFSKNRFHYNWHWFWDYGNGDLGNQGIHQLDLAVMGLGLGFPNRISALGGHFMFDDDQETPNTMNCAFEYREGGRTKAMLEFEVRHWITNHEASVGAGHTHPNVSGEKAVGGLGPQEQTFNSVGNVFYGPKGYLSIDNVTGFKTYLGKEQAPGPSMDGGMDTDTHFENFIECVVSRKKEDLRGPIEQGHIASGFAHLANVSYRLGRTLEFDPVTEMVKNDDEANRLLRDADRGYRAPYVMPESV